MNKTMSKLIEKKEIAKDIFSMKLEFNNALELVKPGQFINILVEGLVLRRPISVCEIEENSITIVFAVRGKGTKKMANFKENDFIDIVAPLGNGFLNPKEKERTLLVGGGLGVAPLLELFKRQYYKIAILGFNRKEEIILEDNFKKHGKTLIYTKDGSYGIEGLVTKNINDIIKKEGLNKIAACGPEPMLNAIALVAKEHNIPCEISLEERMACGIGACLCCQKVLEKDGEKKSFHVCKDGPVFIL